MSIAVEHERFILTAEKLRGDILATYLAKGKCKSSSGGSF
jgi:hypothetical protein